MNKGKIKAHSYSATQIHLLLQLILDASVSLRGSEQVMKIFNDALDHPFASIPCWTSVRSWLLRVGHYKFTRPKQIAEDWCWIIDHTVQLGKTKCLLILGIRLSDLPPHGESLQHKDLEPLDLFPVEHSTGAVVWQQLEKTTEKTGVPRTIVSDFGSDLKAGIGHYCQAHEHCISIYDIKHKTACLLKAIMEKDTAWLEFMKQAAQTKNQLQQTALSYLKAPNQRSKARYMNMESLLKWGKETLQVLYDHDDFTDAEKDKLSKLEWLYDYQDNINHWHELLQVTQLAEQSVRKEGITRQSHQALLESYQTSLPEITHESTVKLKNTLLEFVKHQGENCELGERLLGSSEIIESIFGKHKFLEGNYAKEGFTTLILGFGAIIGKMSVDTIQKALTCSSVKKVKAWCKSNLGFTEHSKKIAVYSGSRIGIGRGSDYN